MAKTGIKLELKNIAPVIKELNNLSVEKANKLNNLIHNEGAYLVSEVMESIAGRRSEKTSVDTGRFLGSIGKDSTLYSFMRAEVKTDLDYPQYLEDGTTKIKGRKHFQMTFDRWLPRVDMKVKSM